MVLSGREYIANILYAFFFRFLPKWGLWICVAAAAVLSADLTLHLNLFGILKTDWCAYSVVGGFYFDPENVYIGFSRLLYPFLSGLLLCRLGKRIRVRNGFVVAALIVLAMFAVPQLGGANRIVDGSYQLLCILFVFPLVLAIGAGSDLSGAKTSSVCKFLGEISFPLYITHYPLIYMHTSWALRHPDAPLGTHIFVGAATLLLALGIAYASLKLYDEPVRNWLKEHWLKR